MTRDSPPLCTYTDADFHTSVQITVNSPGPVACMDFTSLIVDDNIALEGDEVFTIQVGKSVAMVTISDDDGEYL